MSTPDKDTYRGGYAKIYVVENTCMTREEYYSEDRRGDHAGCPVWWHPVRTKKRARR